MTDKQALLVDFARNGSERAFRDLVNAYLNFVFSTALRALGGNRQLAEDVAQHVFIDLARKAAVLPANVSLGGWLHRHTCFLARKALRRELRLKAREQRAVELQVIGDYTEENLGEVSAVLDEAINDLGTEDRTAILLRFFEQLDFQSVGAALGRSEDAARMRVSRALEKLGALLKRRGITSSVAALGFLLETRAVTPAGPGLATKVTKVALANVANGGMFAVMKEACFTRLNIGLVSASVVIGLAALSLATHPATAPAGYAVMKEDPDERTDATQDEFSAQTVVKADTGPTHPPEPVSESREHPDEQPAVPASKGAKPASPVLAAVAAAPVAAPTAKSPAAPLTAANVTANQAPDMQPVLLVLRDSSAGASARVNQNGNGNVRSTAPAPAAPPPLSAHPVASPWQTAPGPSALQSGYGTKAAAQPPVNPPAQSPAPAQSGLGATPPASQMPRFAPVSYNSPPRPISRAPGRPRIPGSSN